MTLLSFVSFAKEVNAQGCNQNGIGDVKCAPSAPKVRPMEMFFLFPGCLVPVLQILWEYWVVEVEHL